MKTVNIDKGHHKLRFASIQDLLMRDRLALDGMAEGIKQVRSFCRIWDENEQIRQKSGERTTKHS